MLFRSGLQSLSKTNQGFGQIVSGVADAAFDFEADPLANAGKLNSSLRKGDYVAVTKDESGAITSAHSTLPLASSSQGVSNFFAGLSSNVHTPEQLDAAIANPLNKGLSRAIEDIAQTKNPVEIGMNYGYKLGWSRNMMDALAKADDEIGRAHV